jgi:hypothetical protein
MTDLSRQYRKHTHREHILSLPDTYIGSIENCSEEHFVVHDESFIHFIEASRYEMALEIYRDVNPKAVEEIELIKTTQTE